MARKGAPPAGDRDLEVAEVHAPDCCCTECISDVDRLADIDRLEFHLGNLRAGVKRLENHGD